MAHEGNGRGWRLAAILGALLAICIGAISTGAVFHYGLVGDVATLDRKVALADREDQAMQLSIERIESQQRLTAADVKHVMAAIQYLCYEQTGKACPTSNE